MAKRKYDLEVIVLSLFVALAPIWGAIGDKATVTYTSLLVSLFILGVLLRKMGAVIITKTAILLLGAGVIALTGMVYASDKASQLSLSAVFVASAFFAVSANTLKIKYGTRAFDNIATKFLYISALIYALVALFYQCFVKANPLFGAMDLGNSSSAATAIVMLVGIVSCIRLFYGKQKSLAFYPSLVFMGLIFIATGSLVSYLAAAVLVLVTALKTKRKKREAFISAAVVALLSLATVIYAFISIASGAFEPQGAFRGIVSIIGIGSGGYNAATAALGGGYVSPVPFYNMLIEAMGLAGVALIGLIIWGAYRVCLKKVSLDRVLIFLIVIIAVCTNSAALCFIMPFLAMQVSLCEGGYEISLNKAWSFALVVPSLFCVLFIFAHIPGQIASHAYDLGKYSLAKDCYSLRASCRIIDSSAYEKAYESAYAYYLESGEGLEECEKHLEKAMQFNKKNYLYRIKLADVYTQKGDTVKSLEIWETVMTRYEKEELYIPYAEKIRDAIRDGNLDITTMEKLYNTLSEYAARAQTPQIKFQVNNILTESQRYYIEKREGKTSVYFTELNPPLTDEQPTDLSEGFTEEV